MQTCALSMDDAIKLSNDGLVVTIVFVDVVVVDVENGDSGIEVLHEGFKLLSKT